MRTLVVAAVALTALAFAGPAAAAGRGKIINWHAVTTVHASGANFTGTFTSSKLGNGTVTYVNSGTDEEIHSVYRVKLKAGTLKGTATTMATPGGMPPTRRPSWARARSRAAPAPTRARRARSRWPAPRTRTAR